MGRTLYRELLRRRPVESWGNFSWLSLRTVLQSGNDVVVKHVDTSIVNQRRMRWVAEQRMHGIDPHAPLRMPEIGRMILLGDPGEMDASQYVLVRDLVETDADALLLMSDVVYPAGNINAWRDAVYLPYLGEPRHLWDAAVRASGQDVPDPPAWKVFALPGNHDWYDGLTGFMYHACGAEPLPRDLFSAEGLTGSQRLAKRLWRNPRRPERATLEPLRRAAARRCAPGRAPDAMPRQPGPYFALDVGGAPDGDAALRLVLIDTGIDGSIDAEQALWLQDVLGGDVPKLLVCGKPQVVDDHVVPVPVDRGRGAPWPMTLAHVVRRHGRRVIASVAGDIHNAQRVVLTGESRPPADGGPGLVLDVEEPARDAVRAWGLPPVHLVAGGGGAYLKATHEVPLTESGGLAIRGVGRIPAEHHTRFPSREQSVVHFARRVGRRAGALVAGHAVLLALVLTTLALAIDGAAREVRVEDVHAATWRVVTGAFEAAALLVLVPLALGGMRGDGPLRGRSWWAAFAAMAGSLAAFLVSFDVGPGQALLLAGAVGCVLAIPVATLGVPVLRAYPELRGKVPARLLVAVAIALLAGSQIEDLDSRVVVIGLVVIAASVSLTATLVAALKDVVNRAAIDGRLRGLRAVTHVVAFWPVVAVGAACAFVPGRLGGGEGVQDAVAIIALVEALAVLLVVSGMLLRAAWHARHALPVLPAVGVLAGAAAGFAGARLAPLDAGWGWEAALALPAGTFVAGLLLLTARRTHLGQVALALQARDGHAAPGLQRDLALFRAMAVAAVPGISEMAEATDPPFHKSFLVLDVETPGEVVLELHGCDAEGCAFLFDRLVLRLS